MLDLHRLMLLREIKTRGSMSAAARNLSYSHSAISQQMGLLEKETGVVLLERSGRGVRLTDAAEQLVRHTEAVLTILERAESDLASAHAEVRGSVRIAAFSTVIRTVMPEALLRLRQLYPELDVEVEQFEPEEGLARLAGNRVDLLVADEYPSIPLSVGSALHAELLCSDPVRVYLPAGGTTDSVADLGEVSWVMEPSGTASFAWAQRLCREMGFEPKVRYQSADLLFHLRMVEAGLAAAFLPGLVVKETSNDLRTSTVFSDDLTRGIHAISRQGSQGRPVILACQAVLREVMATLSTASP
ncbi:LysR substrate-binding domain-containing protein [Streptomyces sp. NPDC001508]|uniref:LysR family transcriptional regulator n=1 Tax=Streptomyces sp. NPDC001508 TaxID=3154656 RepID=UPI00331F99A9